MKLRTFAILSAPVFALAACSGGQSSTAGDASAAASGGAADPAVGALLSVTESQSHGWALTRPPSGTVTVRPTSATAAFERVARAAATDAVGTGTVASDRMQIKTDGVRYASGKTMFGPDGTGTIEELRLNSLTIRAEPQRGRVYEQGNDGSEPQVSAGAKTTGLNAFDGVLRHSAQVTEDGLVFKMAGNAIYFDFQRRFDMGEDINDWYGRGPDGVRGTADDGSDNTKWTGCYSDVNGATADCTNWIHDDVQVTFGRPSSAPHGHHAWYWNTRVPLPTGSSASDANLKSVFDKNYEEFRDLGAYELWMTNLARIDKNLENANGPPVTRDDEAQFLSYAAYGLFAFNENVGFWIQPSRLVGYHFGYDAFADEDDARTTDISTPVTATFKGTTMAQLVQSLTDANRDSASRPLRFDLRGDIELTATIGGSGGGSISGVISSFEMLGPDGTWHPHAAIIDPTKQERLVLTGANYKTRQTGGVFSTANYAADAATISADGSYAGGVYLQYYDSADSMWKDKTARFDTYVTTDQSKFRGRFYGPTGDDLSDLETAGNWYLSSKTTCINEIQTPACTPAIRRTGPVIGSFGAAQ